MTTPATDTAPTQSKAYDPTEIEQKWYQFWEENGFFRTERDPDKKPHVIMMPPPKLASTSPV